MPNDTSPCARSWLRFVYNHNPFYVISAGLVLYGLHLSFADSLDPVQCWLITKLLVGYMLMLAAAGVLVVRLGRVWEDARTLVLLVVLMIVALASSFDRVCLDNDVLGAKLLFTGASFSLAVCELLIRALRVRLPWSYRGPFYVQLMLLFAYPAWLGHLSLGDQVTQLAWCVLGFATTGALTMLLLVPAARRQGLDVVDNGTPWKWPLFPWSLFVFVGVGMALRAFAISLSFEPTKGFMTGFQMFFIIPFVYAWLLLWFEGTAGRRVQWLPAVLPLLLISLALPGPPTSVAQLRYLALVRDAIGAPIQLTLWLLICHFAYVWLRGLRIGEAGLLASICALAFVDRHTVDLGRLAAVDPLPLGIAGGLFILRAVYVGSLSRAWVSVVIVVSGMCYVWRGTWLTADNAYFPLHLVFMAGMLIGLFSSDWTAKQLQKAAATVLVTAALLAVISYRFLFPNVPAATNAVYELGLAAIAFLFWRRNRRFADLVATSICLIVAIVLLLEQLVGTGLTYLLLRGNRWIGWGLVFFIVGLVLSLIKGGQIRRLHRWMVRWHINRVRPHGNTSA